MANTIKLRTGIFAMAIVLSCNLMSWAQSGKVTAPSTTSTASKAQQKYPAAAELKNFKADPANPQLSDMRLSVLKAKSDLEAGRLNNTLSQEQIAEMNKRINVMEAKIRSVSIPNSGVQETNSAATFKNYQKTNQLSRSEFLALDYVQQKVVMTNFSATTITDLVNATPSDLIYVQDNIFYIPAADFIGYDVSKQIHMINNPSNYIVVMDASVIPYKRASQPVSEFNTQEISQQEYNNATPAKKQAMANLKKGVSADKVAVSAEANSQVTPAPTVYKMSRAEFNTFSPEKKKAIQNSKTIEITE